MDEDAVKILALGSSLLQPLFLEHGFAYAELHSGSSSGGGFASGEFRKGNRRMQFHLRHSLGMVTYHLGSRSMSHEAYMRLVLGESNASHYPGFSSDPLDGFRHLRLDLEEHCVDFLEGTDEVFLRDIEDARADRGDAQKLPQ